MQSLFIEELLRLFLNYCSDNPRLFVSNFDHSKTIIGYNYQCDIHQFTHVSASFKQILGYHQKNILCNGNFISNTVHPQDKNDINECLKSIFLSTHSALQLSNVYQFKQVKCRAKHIRGYWKYFIIYSMDYWNSISNAVDKIGLITEERSKSQLQVITCNREIYHINASVPEKYSNSDSTNGLSVINVMISPRESEILQLIGDGMVAKTIAAKLNISLSTVITHRKNIILKFNARNTAELIKKAAKLMLI